MTTLPVAPPAEVVRYARRLTLRYPRQLGTALTLHTTAVVVGLVVPRLLGDLVERAVHGGGGVGVVALAVVGLLVVQSILTRFALYVSGQLGERILADLREEFVESVLALPLSAVERSGSGDLYTRSTRDVEVLSRTVRQAVPDTAVSVLTIVLTLAGLLLTSPMLILPGLVAVPFLWVATRWYLARAGTAYLRVAASYSTVAGQISETVEGAATVETFGLHRRQHRRLDDAIAETWAAERHTLRLRTVYLPIADASFVLPIAATLVVGGLGYMHGLISLAAVTAATIYTQQLVGPVDRLLFWLNELQSSGASLARLIGIPRAPSRSRDTPAASNTTVAAPRTGEVAVRVSGLGFGYHDQRAVLHDINLEVRAGERLAIVGPSGAGKSTLGRLLAGIHRPDQGEITVAGVPAAELSFEQLRRHVALVTQEQHVFSGTLRDNLALARPGATDEDIVAALRTVDAWEWAADIGLDSGADTHHLSLTPPQAQQLALARLVLADPHTVVLDEATAALPPRAARHLERSLAAAMSDRTVIAIAHRLHTAYDSDRIAVMRDGRITELGSHEELLAADGEYAALWRSWHGTGPEDRAGRPIGVPQRST